MSRLAVTGPGVAADPPWQAPPPPWQAPPPPWHALPLEERARLVESGRIDLADWRRQATAWAQTADSRYRACVELRPPHGGDASIRVGVKDTVDVAGFATRLGLPRYRHYPTRSAAALGRVPARSINAKLVTTELSLGLEHGCVNPCFPHLDPAGSSTGCAVAVAAGICDLAMGTDTVASVRLPAGACGVVGLRVTHDPRLLDGMLQVSPLLDAPGWVARSADDLAFLWRRHRLGQPPGADQREPAGRFRVGVVQEALEDSLEPPVRGALNEVCDALAGNGHHLVPVRLGALWRQRGLTYELCTKAAWDRFRPGRGGIDDTLGESVRAALEVGAAVDGARHERLLTELYACRQAVSGRFQAQGVDLWLLPVGPLLPRDLRTTAPPASTIPQPGAPDYWKRVSYAAIASLAGLPAITFPVAHSRSHQAPVVAQAIGPVRSDGRLIQFARTVGRLVGDLDFRLGGGVAAAAPRGGAP